MHSLTPHMYGHVIDYRSVDSVTSQLASAVLDSRGPLQYDDRSMGGTSGGKGLPDGGGGMVEEDDANPWGDEDQAWALQEYVSKYKAQFDSVQKNGANMSSHTPHTFLTSHAPSLYLSHMNTSKVWSVEQVQNQFSQLRDCLRPNCVSYGSWQTLTKMVTWT